MMRLARVVRVLVVITAVGWSTGCGTTRIDNLGEAMSPTLRNGEKVSATRRFDEVNRGDIVAFRYPKDETKSFVKRVVGLPHERIASVAGKVSINGQIISEPYVVAENQSNDSWGPIDIADGQFFMIGDNRQNSSDSRSWGTVRRDAIWAKVIGR